MKPFLTALILCLVPLIAQAKEDLARDIVTGHILPGFARLAQTTGALAEVADRDCAATSPALRAAFDRAFDAWITVSHLRFGPTEVDNRAFALGFWPDSRGATPKTLGRMIRAQDPVAADIAGYAEVSIAARGFYALEFLLFDKGIRETGQAAYRCTLIRTITADTAALSGAIERDWAEGFAEALLNPADPGPYRTQDETVQVLLNALSGGLEFTSQTRLGRPLGRFDKPRPKRAEAWRSARSARHVALSLAALRDLALRLAGKNRDLATDLSAAFDRAEARLAGLDDPAFAAVAIPQGRLRIEALQHAIEGIRMLVRNRLGPQLGVAAGFNALDGD